MTKEKKSCLGLVGKIFGHKYKEYLTNSKPMPGKVHIEEATPKLVKEFLDAAASKKYSIHCIRCGHLIEGDDD